MPAGKVRVGWGRKGKQRLEQRTSGSTVGRSLVPGPGYSDRCEYEVEP